MEAFSEEFIVSIHRFWNQLVEKIPGLLLAILIITIGILLSNIISGFIKRTFFKKTKDPIMSSFLTKAIKLILIIIVIMFALQIVGLDKVATGLFTATGIVGIVLGFAFRDIGENFISGVILSFNRPFDMNDTILVGDIFGVVKSMEFRYTKLKTFDGRDVYVPNSDILKKAFYNYTEDGFFRMDFVVGIDYEDDIEAAKNLILSVVTKTEGVVEDESHESIVTADELSVSTVNLKVYFWVKTMEYRKGALIIKGDVIGKVKDALIKNKFNMPADITEIKLYGSQTSIPVEIKHTITK